MDGGVQDRFAKATLNPTRIQEMEFANRRFRAVVDEGTPVERIESPDFWALVAQSVDVFDEIVVIPDDAAWYAEYIVTDRSPTWAKVVRKTFINLSGEQVERTASDNPDYEVKWKGPFHKFCVLRKKDGGKLKTGFTKAAEAMTWLNEYAKSQIVK